MKKPMFLISSEGKSKKQLADEVWKAFQKFRETEENITKGKGSYGRGEGTIVSLKEMLQEYEKAELDYKLPIMLGVDDSGKNQYSDLTAIGNILMGGQTGSGKSMFAHCIINSLIQYCSPNDLRLLLIDMKRVEFGVYDRLPHLLTDPITDSELVIEWLRKVIDDKRKSKALRPYSVIIIDTYSDIMVSDFRKDFINLISEIIICGPDLGIYVVMYDSRVGEEVFDPVFVSGIKTHICFATASKSGSQLLINSDEGESLLGSGDMLLLKEGKPPLIHLQAPYITSEQVVEAEIYFLPNYKKPEHQTSSKK
jgi:S-DNA-T family DNA segregation ATPase FtsK/SpoIIIE